MSVRAFLSRLAIRAAVKKAGDRELPPQVIRKAFEKRAKILPRPPFFVERQEEELGGVPCTWFRADASDHGVILYFHGGGYVVGSPNTHSNLISYLAKSSGAAVLAADYRLAPEHPCPAAVDDAMAVYTQLLDRGVNPAHIAVGGDSAGGGLTLALTARLLAEQKPLPACLMLYSPWTDLGLSGDAYTTNRKKDCLLNHKEISRFAGFYLNGRPGDDPTASPLFADLKGCPPTLIQVSNTEMLYTDATRLKEKLEETGTPVTYEVWRNMSHVWQYLVGRVPEARKAIRKSADYVRGHIGGQSL